MPSAPLKPCSQPGCGELVKAGRCDEHRTKAEQQRGNRGYQSSGHRHFREAVLARQPICVACKRKSSTEADHYPLSRKQLIDMHLNPNDPIYGRGLCKRCHSKATAKYQPGGWNAPK